MSAGQSLGGSVGMAQETPTVAEADAQVKKAVAVVSVAYVRAKDAGDPETRAFRAQVLMDALGEAMQAAYTYQRAATQEAKSLLTDTASAD